MMEEEENVGYSSGMINHGETEFGYLVGKERNKLTEREMHEAKDG